MWAIATMLFALVALYAMYMYRDMKRHERADRAKREAAYEEAKANLERALKERPGDFKLHTALHATVRRMRNEL